MNKTVALLSISYAIAMLTTMGNPAIITASADTKIILMIFYIMSLINIAFYAGGFVFAWLVSSIGKIRRSRKAADPLVN